MNARIIARLESTGRGGRLADRRLGGRGGYREVACDLQMAEVPGVVDDRRSERSSG
jgi:hypothetical protein